MYTCALILEDLKLKIHLGVTQTERAKKQTVFLQIKINFPKPPLACRTGRIFDTICYNKLTQKIQKFCGNKEFMLIEELGMQLFLVVKKTIPKKYKLYLRISKKPLIRDLKYSIFEIKD